MCVHAKQRLGSTSLMGSSQEIQDVKDKLEDLVPWVTKLQGSLTNPNTSGDLEEVERRTQLTKFAPHFCSLAMLNQSPAGPWMTSRSGLRHCWGKGRYLGPLTRHGTLKPSLGSSTNCRKRSSSTKCVLGAVSFSQLNTRNHRCLSSNQSTIRSCS